MSGRKKPREFLAGRIKDRNARIPPVAREGDGGIGAGGVPIVSLINLLARENA